MGCESSDPRFTWEFAKKGNSKVGAVAQWVKQLLGHGRDGGGESTSQIGEPGSKSQLLQPSNQLPANVPGGQQLVAQEFGFLPLTCKSWVKLQAPGLGPICHHPHCFRHLGSELDNGRSLPLLVLFVSLSLSK